MPIKKNNGLKISQEEYEKRIKELQDELEELKKVKVVDNKPKKGEIWKPENTGIYYYICSDGGINGTIKYEDCILDDCFIGRGNFYKTQQEAEYQANVIKYTNLFRKYVEEHSEPLDWKDDSQEKWFIYWSYKNKCFGFCNSFYGKYQGTIYANSEAVLDDAIEFVGKDNVKKYVLGVIDD